MAKSIRKSIVVHLHGNASKKSFALKVTVGLRGGLPYYVTNPQPTSLNFNSSLLPSENPWLPSLADELWEVAEEVLVKRLVSVVRNE